MSKIIIAFDNGVTGSIAVLFPDGKSSFVETPVIKVRDYTKEVQHCHRIDWKELRQKLPQRNAIAVIERPLVNPHAFVATKSALRALEATLIVLELLDIPYEFLDSKTWQKEFLSPALIGKKQMKKGSMKVAMSLYPNHRTKIEQHGDGDSLLMARYVMLKHEKNETY